MPNIKKRMIIYIAVGAVIALFAVGIIAGKFNIGSTTPAELLSLGEKYLSELNYEQALMQFLKVIEIEPMNERAYLDAAEAYVGLGQTAEAIAILERGLAALPNSAAIAEMLEQLAAPPTEPPPEEPTTRSESVDTDALRALSPDFFGELAIQNLEYELRDGESGGNAAEDLIGYTWINFDFVLSELPHQLAQQIKGCGIWEWQETPFSETQLIDNCMVATQIWGVKDFGASEPITSCLPQGFPTYEDDRGKELQVCVVLTDDDGAAIGYCLANVEVPNRSASASESTAEPTQSEVVIPDDITTLFSRLESAIQSNNHAEARAVVLEAQQTEFVKSQNIIKLNNITMHGSYQVYYFGWLNNGTGRFLEMNHDQNGGFSFQEIDMVSYTFSGEYSWTRYDNEFNRSNHRYGTISNNAVQPPYYEDFFTGTMDGVYTVMDEPHHAQFDESWSPYGEGYTEQLKILAERKNGYVS